jgi:hypothetical protein
MADMNGSVDANALGANVVLNSPVPSFDASGMWIPKLDIPGLSPLI